MNKSILWNNLLCIIKIVKQYSLSKKVYKSGQARGMASEVEGYNDRIIRYRSD
jgi:hypothetical protein